MIRLFIADDHAIFREGLKFVLSQSPDFQIVGEAEESDALLHSIGRTKAEVVVLDVSMPGPGILEVIRRLKSSQRDLRILVLSVHAEQHYARRVLQAGADGYLTKNQSAQALPTAIRQVYAGRKYVTPSLAEELATDLGRGRLPHEALSNREYEVFLRIGAGHSVDHIAHDLGLSPKTVRTYRSRIIEKTNLRSTAQLIFYAVQKGLIPEATEENKIQPVSHRHVAGPPQPRSPLRSRR